MIVVTRGVFDLFHRGHVNLLRRCWEIGHDVNIGLLKDKDVKELQGYTPIMSFEERKEVIKACRYATATVFEIDINNFKKQVECFEADFVIAGSDWAKKDIYKEYRVPKKWLDPYLIYVPYTEGISTTDIKKRI